MHSDMLKKFMYIACICGNNSSNRAVVARPLSILNIDWEKHTLDTQITTTSEGANGK
jgi:hypothetical protein